MIEQNYKLEKLGNSNYERTLQLIFSVALYLAQIIILVMILSGMIIIFGERLTPISAVAITIRALSSMFQPFVDFSVVYDFIIAGACSALYIILLVIAIKAVYNTSNGFFNVCFNKNYNEELKSFVFQDLFAKFKLVFFISIVLFIITRMFFSYEINSFARTAFVLGTCVYISSEFIYLLLCNISKKEAFYKTSMLFLLTIAMVVVFNQIEASIINDFGVGLKLIFGGFFSNMNFEGIVAYLNSFLVYPILLFVLQILFLRAMYMLLVDNNFFKNGSGKACVSTLVGIAITIVLSSVCVEILSKGGMHVENYQMFIEYAKPHLSLLFASITALLWFSCPKNFEDIVKTETPIKE